MTENIVEAVAIPTVGCDTQHKGDESWAMDLAFTLWNHYPGHSWYVKVMGGGIHILNLDWSDKWGFWLRLREVNYDAAVLKRRAVMAAGEFLERARVKRGAKTEQAVHHIEGIADKYVAR